MKIEGLDLEIDFKSVLLIFLPRVKDRLDRALEYLRSSGQRLDGVYVAADSDYAPLDNEEYDVRVVADIIGKWRTWRWKLAEPPLSSPNVST